MNIKQGRGVENIKQGRGEGVENINFTLFNLSCYCLFIFLFNYFKAHILHDYLVV